MDPPAAITDGAVGAIAGGVAGFVGSIVHDVAGSPKDNNLPPLMVMYK